jgi:hypothetical protein
VLFLTLVPEQRQAETAGGDPLAVSSFLGKAGRWQIRARFETQVASSIQRPPTSRCGLGN